MGRERAGVAPPHGTALHGLLFSEDRLMMEGTFFSLFLFARTQ